MADVKRAPQSKSATRRAAPARNAGVRVAIVCEDDSLAEVAPLLRRVAKFALAAEGLHRGEVSIAVVRGRRMARLHAEYSGVPGPTDVLTFDLGSQPEAGIVNGEIVVCSDVARRNARSSAGLHAELALYVTHGTLHLAGYDDAKVSDFRRMHAREDELLRRLGIGPVFHALHRPQRTPRAKAASKPSKGRVKARAASRKSLAASRKPPRASAPRRRISS